MRILCADVADESENCKFVSLFHHRGILKDAVSDN